MKKFVLSIAALLLAVGFSAGANASLDGFLRHLNVEARTDMHGYSVKVAAQFGIPGAQVEAVIRKVDSPADAFMIFELGRMSNRPPEKVMDTYQASKGKGWGVIAKQLGIKPGSPEFHALKRGDLTFTGKPVASHAGPASKGRGRGKSSNAND